MTTLRMRVTFLLLSVLMIVLSAGSVSATVIYVDADAAGNNNGASWENAYTSLEAALEAAGDGDEIWVAAGTYTPSTHPNIADDEMDPEVDARRYNHFSLKNNVALYGGFAGDEKTRNDRDWEKNETVLSGYIREEGEVDHCFHVFYHPKGLRLNKTAVLDGFTITKGYAVGSGDHSYGGGMYNRSSSPTVRNCIFAQNKAYNGGAVGNRTSSTTFVDCTFWDNFAFNTGGGMDNEESSPILENCTFQYNSLWPDFEAVSTFGGGIFNGSGSAPMIIGCVFMHNGPCGAGGGIMNMASSPQVINCVFSHNLASKFDAPMGGAIANRESTLSLTNCTISKNYPVGVTNQFNSLLTLVNCIFLSRITNFDDSTALISYSNIQGAFDDNDVWDESFGVDQGGNIDEDPLFVQSPDPGPDQEWFTADDDPGDLHLTAGSPCVDAGNNEASDIASTDLDDNPRIINGTVDMGVYEYGAAAFTGGGGGGGCFLSALEGEL